MQGSCDAFEFPSEHLPGALGLEPSTWQRSPLWPSPRHTGRFRSASWPSILRKYLVLLCQIKWEITQRLSHMVLFIAQLLDRSLTTTMITVWDSTAICSMGDVCESWINVYMFSIALDVHVCHDNVYWGGCAWNYACPSHG